MTRKEMKQLAKQQLRGNWGVAVGAVLLVALISAGASAIMGIVELLIMGAMSVGLCSLYVNIVRKGSGDITDLFSGFRNFFNNFITGILVSIFTFLWSLLFVIPGIVKSYAYAMTFFIQNDHPEMTETDAITASREMMNGHKWELFVLDLSFFGWYLLCALTFGLLLLYVTPYHNAARAAFYENLVGASQETAQPDASAPVFAEEKSAVDEAPVTENEAGEDGVADAQDDAEPTQEDDFDVDDKTREE